jgi:hypothetical protein
MKIEKYIVLFYNRISGSQAETIEEVPPEVLEFLSAYDYETLIKPFVAEDLRSDMSRDQISIKYGVSPHYGRIVGREIGRFAKKGRSHCTG